MKTLPALACVCCLLSLYTAGAAETLKEKLDREKAAMDSLNATLERDREVLTRTELQKMSTGTQLDRLQQEGTRAKNELRRLSVKEKSLQGRVDRTRQALGVAEKKVVDRRSGIAERLRRSYKLARQNPVAVLLSGTSLGEGVRRLTYLAKAAQQDRVDLAVLMSVKEDVRRTLRLRRTQHTHQQTFVRAKEKKRRELESSVSDYNSRLRRLNREESLLKTTIRENTERFVESQNRFAKLIQEFERQRLAGRRLAELPDFNFDDKQGALPWPVRGQILTGFGRVQDPELGTWTMNRGITIGSDAGTDVLAIAPGEVMLVDWWRGYGQLVLLRHPAGYYSLYSHLESRSVEVGEILAEGALVGTVGSTGRLDGVSQLHLEIMKGEQALDPTAWLEP